MKWTMVKWTVKEAVHRAGLVVAVVCLLGTAAVAEAQTVPDMFSEAGACLACHNGLASPRGEDISIGTDWRGSMMANAARDPYWQAAVRRETLEHPEAAEAIQDECSTCHMPMAHYQAQAEGETFTAFERLPWKGAEGRMAALAADGVSCTVCHQITPEGLGEPESFTGGFVIDTERPEGERVVFGPYAVPGGSVEAMRSSGRFRPEQSRHIQESSLCASCHTLYTHARSGGEVVGELPEQVPYLEWLHSDYAAERSCQSCHMPEVAGETPISSTLGTPRPNVSRHVFRGGNMFIPRVLNTFRDELGVMALPAELDAAVTRTEENLRNRTARLEVWEVSESVDGFRAFVVEVTNLAGHKLPTAYPSRRAWLHVTAVDAAGRTLFESGALQPDGSIAGNDNDADASRYEPHYQRITRPDQVQIWETIMADTDGRVTTGLLNAVEFVKDNRILPRGFDKGTAHADIAVRGPAAGDADFTGGSDRVAYRVPAAGARGPITVRAELWYQPIAFRWAHNLRGFDTVETDRFVRYYETLSEATGYRLQTAERVLE